MDIGIIVDVETTGLDAAKDEIIEVGLLRFVVDREQQASIAGIYGGLQQASKPLPDEIIKLTGLRDELLQGQSIDWELVRTWLGEASVVVAHNMPFDRAFLLGRPELAELKLHWACSQRHIDWASKGYGSEKLNYLAADHGFINPFAHRAVFDCATTFRLVAPYMRELVERSYEPHFRLFAVGSPFETKDILRQRRFRWDAEKRCWYKDLLQSDLAGEKSFLCEKVYGGKDKSITEEIEI